MRGASDIREAATRTQIGDLVASIDALSGEKRVAEERESTLTTRLAQLEASIAGASAELSSKQAAIARHSRERRTCSPPCLGLSRRPRAEWSFPGGLLRRDGEETPVSFDSPYAMRGVKQG